MISAWGDFDPTSLAEQTVGGIGFYTWGSNEALRQEVQSWLDDPLTNYGWLVRGDESESSTAKRFDSKEHTTVSNRPQLTVYYTPITSALSVKENSIPQKFSLGQNYPNPFNPSTRIDFDVARAGYIMVTVYNMLGQEVKNLFSEYLTRNSYSMEWHGKNSVQQDVPSGFYFYVLQAEHYKSSKKMLLIR
jgi:hypothetical protein